jgi:hypothetical protein
MGGATVHNPGCPIGKLIDDFKQGLIAPKEEQH